MRVDESDAQEFRFAGTAVLVPVVFLALVTWAQLAGAGGDYGWWPVAGIAATVFLGLAALTQCPRRAALSRLLAGAWIIAAPHLFGFGKTAPALWINLVVGAVVAASALTASSPSPPRWGRRGRGEVGKPGACGIRP